MKKATITETKNNLSALIHAVRRGERVIVTDRKKPVARIEPVLAAEVEDADTRLERLQREGIVQSPRGGRLDIILGQPPVRPGKRVSVVRALLDERAESR